ncbi:hypothetical protein ABEB36_000872 [Hypothenemus hampei]|uniref:C-type lectin domain-containing protein n=1 Tax=Hypothenemus hampei TaxID=57062 RepID=A0ABD1FEK6_HYPHA
MQRLQEILFLCSTIVFTTSENLTKPNLLMSCLTRSVHLESPLGNEYYVSWLGAQPDKNWLDAKTYCRKMSMDLVSLETHAENMLIKEFLTSMGIEEIWTSGRLCNFPSCQYKNEWFWTASLKRIPAAHDFLISDWALEGPARQPDNKQVDKCFLFSRLNN